MSKKIRHLEFYGFNDQNGYVGLPNADLSEIHKTNRDQDRDISDLSGVTKGKADICMVKKVSDKLDKFVDIQSHINKKFVGGFKIAFENIDKIKHRDIKSIVKTINDIIDGLDSANDEITKIKERLDKNDETHNDTDGKLDGIDSVLGDKLDKSEADETYAKKDETYTKEEVNGVIDEKLVGFATEEWVECKGYVTLTYADEIYATNSHVASLEESLTRINSDLTGKYNDLSVSLTTFKNETDTRFTKIENEAEFAHKKYDAEIAELKQKDTVLEKGIEKNASDIVTINGILQTKASQSSVDELSAKVDVIDKTLPTKLDVEEFDKYKISIGKGLDGLDNKKADKSALEETNNNLKDLSDKLDTEIQDRQKGDDDLDDKITAVNERVNVIVEENIERDAWIEKLDKKIDNEADERQDADDAIIGSEYDKADAITVHGARKYADLMSSNALNKAKAYVDEIDSALRQYSDDNDAELRLAISAKADKEYVNNAINDAKSVMSDEIAKETKRAMDAETGLDNKIAMMSGDANKEINILRQSLNDTTNIVNAITSWKGDDALNYTDEGNGILDILHREFEKLAQRVDALERKLS